VAIFHFTADIVSRKAGQSAIAKAAYISRSRLTDERDGEARDFRAAGGSLFSGIFLPKDAPEWAHDRAQLWNEAERAEDRSTRPHDATVARTYEMALPHELTDEQRRYLVQDFVKENFTRKGYAADVALHAPDKEGDNRNYHAHILVTDRRLEQDGFAKNKRERQGKEKERKAELEHLRERWEHHTNRQLERYGHAERVDRRSLEAQGIDREPTQHLGPTATELEREGKGSERGKENREIEERNQDRAELRDIEKELATALDREHKDLRAKLHEKAEAQKAEREQRKEAEREQQKKRDESRAAKLGATLYDRADMVSMQRDAMKDLRERNKERPAATPQAKRDDDRQEQQRREMNDDDNKRRQTREEEKPRYKSVAERVAESRARSIAEAERRRSLSPEQRREEDRQRDERERVNRERDRGGRERER
jgi:hypothetical protein